MNKPADIPGIRNITISGRIATGATTLAIHLSKAIDWELLNGGQLFRKFSAEKGLDIVRTNTRPDQIDLEYEESIKKLLTEKSHQIIQSHLAGLDAQGIKGIFKILVVCEDEQGEDKVDIRIDRLMNRDGKKVDEAKEEVQERERLNLEKWRRLYANNDPEWIYWDKKYYDLVVNTYSLNPEESTQTVLKAIKFAK